MDLNLSYNILRIIGKNSDMWHIVQVCSPEKSKNKHIVGKLQRFPTGTSYFNKIYVIGKRTYQATTDQNFRLIRAEISYLPQVEGQPTKQ